jgi:hypothetical protein
MPWASPERLHASGAFFGAGLASPVRLDRRAEQRVELCLVEEADVRIGLGRHRFLGRPTWIHEHPALAQRELEDAVQEAQVVSSALDRLAAIQADEHELLDVVLAYARERFLAEVRPQMDREMGPVRGERRDLATRVESCRISRSPASVTVIRSATGGSATSPINLRNLASAIVLVRPSREPGTRTGPSLRETIRSRTRHWPYQAPRFWKTLPVP